MAVEDRVSVASWLSIACSRERFMAWEVCCCACTLGPLTRRSRHVLLVRLKDHVSFRICLWR